MRPADGDFGSPLRFAALGGRKVMVQLLLKFIGVKDDDGAYIEAVHAASSRGHEAVVRLLLDGRRHLKATDGLCDLALQEAAIEGSEAVVRLQRNEGANAMLRVRSTVRLCMLQHIWAMRRCCCC